MTTFLIYLIIGITTGAIYAVAASGLVVTYATSRIFNFAHGAIGMLMAFLMYTLWVEQGWNEWISLVVCVLVVAPLIGVALDFFVMRWLENTSVAQRLSVTLTIFILCQGLAQWIWGTDLRTMPHLFGSHLFTPLHGLNVTSDQLVTVLIAVVVAAGLWFLFRRTRTGAIMRGVVDDRTLTELHGINPRFITSFSWALGCSLAALAAILLAPGLSLSINQLSLLVVSAYGAAVVGRLVSVPWTFAAALALGVATAMMVGYLPAENQWFQNAANAAPFILLFGALVLRRAQFSLERVQVFREPRPPKTRTMIVLAVVGVAVVSVVTPLFSDVYALVVANGLIYAGVLLSLVLVAGMAGQVSLAQWTFVGISEVTLSHVVSDHHLSYWIAVLISTLVSMVVGALVALPALRLRGLYLALSTLAFAVLADEVFFSSSSIFPQQGSGIAVPSPNLFGYNLNTYAKISPLIAAVVAVYAIGILVIRRGRLGRALSALRDAPAAASALGLNVVRVKLLVFSLASGMAGLMGCLSGGVYHQAFSSQFAYLTSLIALLILVIQGITSISGAIVGAGFYALFYLMLPNWISNPDIVTALQPLGIGLAVFGLARHPEGAIAQTRATFRRKGQGPGGATTGSPAGADLARSARPASTRPGAGQPARSSSGAH